MLRYADTCTLDSLVYTDERAQCVALVTADVTHIRVHIEGLSFLQRVKLFDNARRLRAEVRERDRVRRELRTKEYQLRLEQRYLAGAAQYAAAARQSLPRVPLNAASEIALKKQGFF